MTDQTHGTCGVLGCDAPQCRHSEAAKAWTSLGQAVGESMGLANTAWTEYMGDHQPNEKELQNVGEELLKFIRRGALDPTRSKGEAIVEDCLIRDEPFFVFRARDIFSLMALKTYLRQLEDFGPDDPEFHESIVNCLNDFREWQTQNVRDVRYPD